jgi:hypothetical protein
MKTLRSILFGSHKTPGATCCGNCDSFNNEPGFLEEHFRGINALSSVRGSTRGDGGICKLHKRYLLPVHSCPEFRRKKGQEV